MSGDWKRPQSVPVPTVWARFEGRASKKQFWIQDITEEYVEPVVKYMCTDFLRDEVICKASKVIEDKEAVEELGQLWNVLLSQKLGLICLTKGDDGKDTIVAMNCTCRASKDDKPLVLKNALAKKLIDTMEYVSHMKDVFGLLDIDSYLSAMGLLVLPGYRGDGVAVEMLKAREPLSRAVGLKASLTVFTWFGSQKAAEKAGFVELVDAPFKDLEKANPTFVYPGCHEYTRSMKLMYKLYK